MESSCRRPRARPGPPKASEFVFARLRYDSGDWDYNPKVAANVLNSLVEYTTIPVYPEEVVITADSKDLLSFPFLFMTGHKLVRFSREERDQLKLVRRAGRASCSPTTATTTSTACTPRASSRRCARSFPAPATLREAAGAASALSLLLPVSRRPADDLARAERLGRRHRPRLPARGGAPRPHRRALLQQGLRLRVGLRLAQQALPARGQHQVRGQHRRLCDDVVILVGWRSRLARSRSCAGSQA